MKKSIRFLHDFYRKWTKMYLSLGYDFYTWQEEELPPGPKIFCSNHFTSSDAHYVTTLMKDDLHMVIGPGFNVPFVKHYLKWCEQIPANTKETRANVISEAVKYLKQGDSVYIFPEGMLNTGKELIEFRKGLARIYLEYPVPIIPIGLISPIRRIKHKKESGFLGHSLTVVSRNYYANIGRPMEFEEELELAKTDKKQAEQNIMDKVKNRVQELIDDIKNEKFWS